MSDGGGEERKQTDGNPVARIIECFGGLHPLATKLEVPAGIVEDWQDERYIPPDRRASLEEAAKKAGITLDAKDLDAAMAPRVKRKNDDFRVAPQPDSTPEAAAKPSRPKAPAKGGSGFGAALWMLVLLAGLAGGAFAAKDKWLPFARQYLADPRLDTLEQRLEAVENQGGAGREALDQQLTRLAGRIAALEKTAETARATPAPALGDARAETLNERLTNVERQVMAIPRIDVDALTGLKTGQTRLSEGMDKLVARVDGLDRSVARKVSAQQTEAALVLAVGQLREATNHSGGFRKQLTAVRAVAPEDPGVQEPAAVLAAFADEGLETAANLRDRFPEVGDRIVAAALTPTDPTWQTRVVAKLTTLVTIRRTADNLAGDTTDAIVARAEAALRNGDLAAAVTHLDGLQGTPSEAAAVWLGKARARLVADKAMSMLDAHAISRLTGERG